MELLSILWIIGYVLAISAGIYRYFVWNYDYFIEQGIPGPQPIPVFGNWWGMWKKKWHEVELERYKKYGKIYGTFDGRRPNTVIADTNLMRQILIRDFENFTNRREFHGKDKYVSKILSFQNGQHWKHTRNALSPAFTSAKVKLMTPLMCEIAESMVKVLHNKVEAGAKKIDLKNVFTGYALDVVASCGYGTKTDAVKDLDGGFAKMALNIFNTDLFKTPLYVIIQLYGNLTNLFSVNQFDTFGFFTKLAAKMIATRKIEIEANPNGAKRNDFLDIMLENRKSSDGKVAVIKDDDMLVSQVLQFLMAGFESTAAVLAVILNCLANNEQVQDKLRAEIRESITKHGGISAETVTGLSYLQQVIWETLRMYPTGIRLERVCNRTTFFEGAKIKKGTMVSIPVYAIHHDPEIYEDPESFNPERFSAEERNKRDPMTFLPFGEGPRNCIAMRFAMEEMKIAICYIINEFQIVRVFETLETPNFLEGAMPLLLVSKVIVGIKKAKNPVKPVE